MENYSKVTIEITPLTPPESVKTALLKRLMCGAIEREGGTPNIIKATFDILKKDITDMENCDNTKEIMVFVENAVEIARRLSEETSH